MTRQRRVILEELQRDPSHPTAGEIHLRVRRRLPRTSLGTVYRNLHVLTEQGRVRRLALGDSPGRFDGIAQAHPHLRCVRCGVVVDAPPGSFALRREAVRRASGFEVLACQVELSGLCPACRRRR